MSSRPLLSIKHECYRAVKLCGDGTAVALHGNFLIYTIKGVQRNFCPQILSLTYSQLLSPGQQVPFPQLLSHDGILTWGCRMAAAQNKPIGNCYWLLSPGYFPGRPVLQFSLWTRLYGTLRWALHVLAFSLQFKSFYKVFREKDPR